MVCSRLADLAVGTAVGLTIGMITSNKELGSSGVFKNGSFYSGGSQPHRGGSLYDNASLRYTATTRIVALRAEEDKGTLGC